MYFEPRRQFFFSFLSTASSPNSINISTENQLYKY